MDAYQTVVSPIQGGAKKVTYTDTAGTTAAVSGNATSVWCVTTTDAFVRVGGTAVVDADLYVPAFTPVVLWCGPGAVVSAIRVSASGTLYVTPLA